jgi:hypothetical protein
MSSNNLEDKFYSPARDGGGVPLPSLDDFYVAVAEPSAFAGGTTNARGDDGGTNDPLTLFNVTGDVLVRLYGVCTTTLVGAATLEVGVTGNTAELLAQVADATDIAAGDIWVDGTVDDVRAATFADVVGPKLITNGADIIETVGTTNITAGNIYYVCLWRPIVEGSKVVSAV